MLKGFNMDKIVKLSIEARRNAFDTSYEIKDEDLKKEIDVLFEKINKLGEEAKDAMDFETKFASSPLNTEYTNLFTKIASCSKPIIHESAPDHHIKSDEEYVTEDQCLQEEKHERPLIVKCVILHWVK